jgi:Domain of unknown function (DUF4124)
MKYNSLLIFCFAFCSSAQAQVYRCIEEGEIVFSNESSNAKKKNCSRVNSPKPVRAPPTADEAPRMAKRSAESVNPVRSSSATGFPRVDASTQKYRDNDRAAILDEERRKEAILLESLRKEFNNGAPERRTDELEQKKYLDRIEKLKQSILRAETNVNSLERELRSVK